MSTPFRFLFTKLSLFRAHPANKFEMPQISLKLSCDFIVYADKIYLLMPNIFCGDFSSVAVKCTLRRSQNGIYHCLTRARKLQHEHCCWKRTLAMEPLTVCLCWKFLKYSILSFVVILANSSVSLIACFRYSSLELKKKVEERIWALLFHCRKLMSMLRKRCVALWFWPAEIIRHKSYWPAKRKKTKSNWHFFFFLQQPLSDTNFKSMHHQQYSYQQHR